MPAEKYQLVIYLAFSENDCPRTEMLTQDPQLYAEDLPMFAYRQPLNFSGELQRQFLTSVVNAARMRTACQETALHEEDLALTFLLGKYSQDSC